MDLALEYDPPLTLSAVKLRDYQVQAIEKIEAGWSTNSRQLLVLATGLGKTVTFSAITAMEVARGGRVLIIAHSEELLDQAAEKLHRTTGLDSEREKADQVASPNAKVVIASVQTLSRDRRLTAFNDDHFSLVVVDETHRILAKSYLKVVSYFHFGAESLNDDWVMPEPGAPYTPRCRLLGVTATPDRGDGRNLGQIFQRCAFEYGIIDGVKNGYLVRLVAKTLPIKIDLKGVKRKGNDLDAEAVAERLTPLLRVIAGQIRQEAIDRKTMIWMPSVDSARRMAQALAETGLAASFVSGACPDRVQKIEAFRRAGKGSVIVNAMLLTEGVDIPDVDCCCMLRATEIRSLLMQAMGRGTRVLPGVIDHLDTPHERVAAIAASAKPNMLILDFLWLGDRLDLVKAVDLVAGRPEVAGAMGAEAEKGGQVDLLDLEGAASRDLLAALEKAAKRNARKSARTYDPLAWAVDLGDEKLATYEPKTSLDARAPTDGQIAFLKRQHFDVGKVTSFGLASAVIGRLMTRFKSDLATPAQLHFLHQLGLPAEKAATLTASEATATIERLKARKPDTAQAQAASGPL